jgi:hypothetical protein
MSGIRSTKEHPMSSQRSLTARLRFRPRVEDLEGRWVPTVMVVPGGGSLTLTGVGKAAHTYQIIDDGKGDVSVTGDGVQSSFTNISSITINGAKGADSVTYLLTGPLQQAQSITANLGKGANSFVGLVQQGVKAGGSLSLNLAGKGTETYALNVLGGVEAGGSVNAVLNPAGATKATETVNFLNGKIAGTVTLDLEGTTGADAENVMINGDIDTSGFVMVQERGKPGNDTENILYTGQDKGTLLTQADGGPGNDTINTQITLNTGSSGVVIAGEQGGPGNDKLTLAVRKQTGDNPTVQATVNGGPGMDTAMVTPGVTTTAVEHVVMIM